jgi:formiminotetrahydrofolate cyclodeaminase
VLVDLPIKSFLEKVASGEPVPGGGSVSALCGALSSALSEMVARLTTGKTNDKALDSKMSQIIEIASHIRVKLVENIDRDSDAYTAVMKAYRMAKDTDVEKRSRQHAIQEALKEATRVPLSVADMGIRLLDLAESLIREGNQNAVTDAAVAALIARSAVIGAVFNVRINLLSIKDATFRDSAKRQAEQLEEKAMEKEKDILVLATSMLGGQG